MTAKQAIRILILSPCYWRLSLPARKQLVREYCSSYAAAALVGAQPSKKTLSP